MDFRLGINFWINWCYLASFRRYFN